MDFNLVLEILIASGILITIVVVVIVQRNILELKNTFNLGSNNLKIRLKLAKQKKEVLSQKEVLSRNINTTLLPNMFTVINRLLSLQKFLIQK
ncbi:hypothetical protein [Seonamhaeicola sp. ML3]|uniref:hypothetical protein n=1 Tax=Seonamhaeicola sp. ML3 TaxID=2937786 RepID=UPI00200D8A52|nr:hypothetical protein [Seonamhaeicola sp. ML3]